MFKLKVHTYIRIVHMLSNIQLKNLNLIVEEKVLLKVPSFFF